MLGLYTDVLTGLRAAAREEQLAGVAVDSWAVDYGLLDARGTLQGNPRHYRDPRTDAVIDDVHAKVDRARLYGVTGLQFLPFNTLYQLAAEPALDGRRALLMPDLLGYWLTGRQVAEETNASTTGLLDARTGGWSTPLVEALGLPPGLLPDVIAAGAVLAPLTAEVSADIGVDYALPVTTVGSHDTASAVVGVPADNPRFGYISCGTWGLVGVELDAPVLTEDSRRANFTSGLGVDGTVRYLRNVMGLWLLQESLRTWEDGGVAVPLGPLLREAAAVPALSRLIDPDDPDLLPPGDMPSRIADACRRHGQPAPQTRAETVRCVLDSLALAYRRTVRRAQELAGRRVDVVHLVGGGARNDLLCQLTADACGLPVEAGPVEAAALGNVLVQARAVGAVPAGLAGMRDLLRRTQQIRRFEPSGSATAWDDAERRLGADG